MYRLLYQDGDQARTHDFDTGEVLIGRAPECQICIADFSISRRHAAVRVDERGPRLVDLESKNGSQVNGVSVIEAPLQSGDRILLGRFELTFTRTPASHVVLEDESPPAEAATIVRSVGEVSRLLAGSAAKEQPGHASPDVRKLQSANRILRVLTRVAEMLIAVRPMEEVLHQVMDLVFENLPAERGFLVLIDRDSGELTPAVVKHRANRAEKSITLSRQIVDKVIRDRVAILVSDATIDSRFDAGDSISIHGIRSAVCAPLWSGDQVVGIVFVDAPVLMGGFTEDDLDLLTALANYAAVAVERFRLNGRILAEEKKRDRLGRFLSPQVASRVLAASDTDADALGSPEVRQVSVLFADICGFTAMAERMSAAAVAVLLNEHLGQMTDVIFEEEGTLDKYIGDAIMAVFGAPLDMPDHATRAVRAAIAMRSLLVEMNADREPEAALRIRIGINSGEVVACEIGGQGKREYTVLGDAVNIASRLESSVAAPMTIVVGQSTYEAVAGQFDMRPLGSATLKGKALPVVAHEVLGPLHPARPEPGS